MARWRVKHGSFTLYLADSITSGAAEFLREAHEA